MPQNYIITHGMIGEYVRGDVVPEYVLLGHNIPELIDRKMVQPTDSPVTVKVTHPKPASDTIPDDVYAERNRLYQEHAKATGDNKQLYAQVHELEGKNKALRDQLGQHVEEIAHLKEACEKHQESAKQAEERAKAAEEKAAALEAQVKEQGDRLAQLDKGKDAGKAEVKAPETQRQPIPPQSRR